MKLQVALDCSCEEQALDIAQKVNDYVDIIEAGTSLIKIAGIQIVPKLKKLCPGKIILADLKTMDAGRFEADFSFKAGADIVTVCGAADDGTIAGAVASARSFGKKVMVDLLNVTDKPKRALEAQKLGADYIGVHSGIDPHNQSMTPLCALREIAEATDIPLIVAGRIGLDTIEEIASVNPSVVVVGGAITSAKYPREAARKLRGKLNIP